MPSIFKKEWTTSQNAIIIDFPLYNAQFYGTLHGQRLSKIGLKINQKKSEFGVSSKKLVRVYEY